MRIKPDKPFYLKNILLSFPSLTESVVNLPGTEALRQHTFSPTSSLFHYAQAILVFLQFLEHTKNFPTQGIATGYSLSWNSLLCLEQSLPQS